MDGIEEGKAAEKYNTLADRTGYLRNRIQMSLDFLCKNSTNLPEVLVHLISTKVISQHESEVVENQLSNYTRFQQLFTFLIPRLGHEDNSGRFVDAFQHSGNEHILEELENAVLTNDSAPVPLATSSQNVQFNVKEQVPSFVGRTDFLRDLHQQILKSRLTTADDSTNSTIASRICVVTGLGGIGKTQTIRKYIHSYGKYYQHVVWIDAEENTTAENQFRRLALQKLHLSSKDKENNANDFDFIIDEIYDRLCTSHTLIVFDNAETLDDSDSQRTAIRRFLPKRLPPTHLEPVIIVTSRQLEWPDIEPTPLPLFTPQESSTFIFNQLKLEESDANKKDAGTLSKTFDGLPLALQAAAAVILQECKRNRMMGKDAYTIQHLLSDYNQEKRKVLEKRSLGSPDSTPLLFLWKVSLDKIRQQPQGHLASDMLDVMAHLFSTNIPKDLLFFIFNHEDIDNLVDAVTLLVDYSFVHNYDKQFSIHRILQDVTLTHLEAHNDKNPDEDELLSTRPLTRITTALREYWPTVPKSGEAYYAVHDNLVHVTMSHVLPNAKNPLETELHFIKFIEFVVNKIIETRPVEAETGCRVLINYFKSLPSHSESTSRSLTFRRLHCHLIQLALILQMMGRYQEAEDICHKALSFVISLINQEDVTDEIMITGSSLASILYKQGKEEDSIELLYCTLGCISNLCGPTNPLTLATKTNLAVILQDSGRLIEAKTLHAEILEVRMKDSGPLHPDTLDSKHNMGVILMKEGHYDDALEMLRKVVEGQERELGPLHVDTLISNFSMAAVLERQGNYEDALGIYAHVIKRYEKASAACRLDCLNIKNDMAAILGKHGRLDEANEILCHVLEAEARLVKPSHISILSTKRNKALVLSKQGKHAEALKLFQEVLEPATKQFGPVHRYTLETKQSIGWLHLEMGNFEKAESIAKEVLVAGRETLLADHPSFKHTLLLLDNAEALHDINHQRHGDLNPMSLPLWTPQESTAFIFRQLKLKESDDANEKDAETLSETFGGLPLALRVATAVILQESKWNALKEKDAYTNQHLISDYNQVKQKDLNKRPPCSPDAPPLMFFWKVALEKIRQQPHGHLATQILNVMAHLMSTNIPKELLFVIFNYIDGKRLVEAVALLVDYSFVQLSDTHCSIHHMLQDITLAHLEAHKDENPNEEELLLLSTPLTLITTALMEYWPQLQECGDAVEAVHDNLVHVTMSHVLPKLQNPADTDSHLISFTEFVLEKIEDTRPVEAKQFCRLLISFFTRSAIPFSSGSLLEATYFKTVLRLQRQLPRILIDLSRYKEAADICQRLLDFFNSLEDQGSFVEEILTTKNALAMILDQQGEYEEAIQFFHSAVDRSSNLLGPNHQTTLLTKNNLASALQNSGRLIEARTLHTEILGVTIKDLGPLHVDTLSAKHNIALILLDEGCYDDALKMLREVAEVQERKLGPLHADTLRSNANMAVVLDKQGKHEDALNIYESVISRYEKVSTASDPECLNAKNGMALMLGKQGRFDEAKEILRQLLDIQERLFGPNHYYTLCTKESMAWVLMEQGKHAESLKLYEEVLELMTNHLVPVYPPLSLETKHNMGCLHLKMGNFEKAESILKEVLAARQATLASNHPDIKDTEALYNKACLRNDS